MAKGQKKSHKEIRKPKKKAEKSRPPSTLVASVAKVMAPR